MKGWPGPPAFHFCPKETSTSTPPATSEEIGIRGGGDDDDAGARKADGGGGGGGGSSEDRLRIIKLDGSSARHHCSVCARALLP